MARHLCRIEAHMKKLAIFSVALILSITVNADDVVMRAPPGILTDTGGPCTTPRADRDTKGLYSECFRQRTFNGFNVFVHHATTDNVSEADLGRVLDRLRAEIAHTTYALPPAALEKLRAIPTLIGDFRDFCGWGCYTGDIVITVPTISELNDYYKRWADMPVAWFMHELAHGYHHRYLEGSWENACIRNAYQDAFAKYGQQKFLRSTTWFTAYHQPVRETHYGMKNHHEFFAVFSVAYYGHDDWYPFNRAEFVDWDPTMAKLIRNLWETGECSSQEGM